MIVIDIETTGLNPKKHSIVEIGAIDFLNPINQFYQKCQIWEGAEIDPKALEINGSKLDEIIDDKRISLEELIRSFIDWISNIDNKTIAGHNVNFDIHFLNESVNKYNINWNFGWRYVDQHSLFYAHLLKRNIMPPLKNGLSSLSGDFIMKYVGLPLEPKPHIGINGARYEAEAISRLIFGKNLLSEFEEYNIPDYIL